MIRENTFPADAVTSLERAVAKYVGAPQAAASNSGRRGMALVFQHIGLRAGDEVIVPALTLGELLPLIERFGARAVPADISQATLNMSPEGVQRRMSARTKAILALHAFGNPCDVASIIDIGRNHHVPVIEDCAHSLGATCRGKHTGTFGYAGFYSLETTKPLSTLGGGMVVSKDVGLAHHIRTAQRDDRPGTESIEQKIAAMRREELLYRTGLAFPLLFMLATPAFAQGMTRLYRRFGRHPVPEEIAYSPAQAVIGLENLASLEARIRTRQAAAELYRRLLAPEIGTQRISAESSSTWYFFVAVLPKEAAEVRKRLLLRGIDAGVGHEVIDDCAALLGYDDCPNATALFPRLIALPMYDGIRPKEVERVANTLNRVVS